MKSVTTAALLTSTALLALASVATAQGTPKPATTEQTDKGETDEDANAAFDRIVDEATSELFKLQPAYASVLNIPEEQAGGRYKDRFGTPGIAGYEEMKAYSDEVEAELEGLDASALTPERQEYLAILLGDQENADELDAIEEKTGYYLAGGYNSPYVVNQIGGIHTNLPQLMTQLHGLASADDADAYVTRLGLFGEQFDGAIEVMNANAEAGAIPPDYAIDGAIAQAKMFVDGPASENVLVTHLTDTLPEIGVDDVDGYRQRATQAVEETVYPAYQRLIAALEELRPQATHEAGIWDIPEGERLYDALIVANGESELDGDGVHKLGLSEVARIEGEMEALFEEIGMTEGTVGERLAALTADPEQVFPNTPEGKEELLSYTRGLVSEAEGVMGEYFLVTPKNSVVVEPVPAYAEQGAAGGSYMSPAEDGSRPGMFMINLRDTAIQPRYTLPTLVYHETVPGHHFQLALATDAKETPLLVRQSASSTGFAEGWGLYAENFAKEIGMYKDDPEGDIGRLQAEMFRAVRLVVDSGMHAKHWSREKAVDYMVKTTGMERSDVESEIERYSVWPGQALAYKTGMLKIQELRARAEEALGDDFDVAAFHYQVLRDGGAPLRVLEKRIDEWIAKGGPAPKLAASDTAGSKEKSNEKG